MLRHWLVRNGHHVECICVYIKTSDDHSKCQLEQVTDDVLKRGWNLKDVYVIERATSKAYKTLYQLILEKLR